MARIDPWSAEGIKNYERVFREFGLKPLPETWRSELNHRFFSRGIIVAHRDFAKVLTVIRKSKPFINMTGIASSGPYHLGHKCIVDIFMFFKQFGAKNYFCVSDIDAYTSRPDRVVPNIEAAKRNAVNNVAHLLAFGLNRKDLYLQSKKEPRYYEFTFELSKKITRNMFEAVYGHVDLGKMSAALLQFADILHPQLPEYEGCMPSITVVGVDQDPHARLVRDIARRLPYELELPSFLYIKHQSGLQKGTKMSSSVKDSAIFLDDPPEVAKRKIMRAFTGGQPTIKEQREKGANVEICKVCELLRYHFPDDKTVNKILEEERTGKRLCGETKEFAADFICSFLEKHQSKVRKKLSVAERIVFG